MHTTTIIKASDGREAKIGHETDWSGMAHVYEKSVTLGTALPAWIVRALMDRSGDLNRAELNEACSVLAALAGGRDHHHSTTDLCMRAMARMAVAAAEIRDLHDKLKRQSLVVKAARMCVQNPVGVHDALRALDDAQDAVSPISKLETSAPESPQLTRAEVAQMIAEEREKLIEACVSARNRCGTRGTITTSFDMELINALQQIGRAHV